MIQSPAEPKSAEQVIQFITHADPAACWDEARLLDTTTIAEAGVTSSSKDDAHKVELVPSQFPQTQTFSLHAPATLQAVTAGKFDEAMTVEL